MTDAQHQFKNALRRIAIMSSEGYYTLTADPDSADKKDDTKSDESKKEIGILLILFGAVAGIALIGLLCLYRKKIRRSYRRCQRKIRRSQNQSRTVATAEEEQFSSLDKILFASTREGGGKRSADESMDAASSDLDDFADLMNESFAKKSKEREEMEKRFGQPLL